MGRNAIQRDDLDMKRYTRYYDIYEEKPYKGYMRGNMENKISMTILWIYLTTFAIMFTRGLILFLSR